MVSVTVAGLGLAATTGVTAVFWRHNDTPVVKASTRELSYIILGGLALAYAATFALVAKPTPAACAAASVLPGVAFAFVYGALVTKTNRIARVLAGSKKIRTGKLRFMSATAQVCDASSRPFVSIQLRIPRRRHGHRHRRGILRRHPRADRRENVGVSLSLPWE